jgi:acetylornithine deacetylase
MMKVMERIKGLEFDVHDPDLPGAPRWVVGSIIGGRSREYDLAGPYNIPDFCTIIVDLRYPPGLTIEEVNARVVEMLEEIGAEDPEFRYEFEYPVNPRFRVGGVVMPPMGVSPDAEVVQILKESHKTVTGEYPRWVGAVPPYSYCGNDTAHLERAGIECCLYGPRGYKDEVEKHVSRETRQDRRDGHMREDPCHHGRRGLHIHEEMGTSRLMERRTRSDAASVY